MSVPPLRVVGIDAPATTTLTIGSTAKSISFRHHGSEVAFIDGDGLHVLDNLSVRGERVPRWTEVVTPAALDAFVGRQSDAAFVGGIYGALSVIVSFQLLQASRQLLRAWRNRAWLARQPRPEPTPYR